MSFIEALAHAKGSGAGKPFELIDWQEQIIRYVFGNLKLNGYRQFNNAYVEFPKKMVYHQGLEPVPLSNTPSYVRVCQIRRDHNYNVRIVRMSRGRPKVNR